MEKITTKLDILNEYQDFKKEYPILEDKLFKYQKNGKNYINTDIFVKSLGYSIDELQNLNTEKAKEIVRKYKEQKKEILKKLTNFEKQLNTENFQEYLIYQNIQKDKIYLDLVESGLVFELEKIQPDLFSEKEKQESLAKLESIESKLYGPKTINQAELVEKIYTKVYLAFINGQNNLNSKQKNILQQFLQKIQKHLPKDSQLKSLGAITKNGNELPLEKQLFNQKDISKLTEKKISAQEAKKIFELVFDIYNQIYQGLFKNYQVEVEDRNSVSITWDKLKLKNQEYDLKHIIKLISHEVEKHATKYINMQSNFGKIQDSNYNEMEESMAVLFENFVLYGKEVLISPIIPLTMAGEIFDKPEDLQNFIEAYLKAINMYKENDEEKRFLRLKQFMPFDGPYVHRKGVIYTSGIEKILNLRKNHGFSFKDFFYGSLSYQTYEKFGTDFKKHFETITFPLLIGEILRYILTNENLDEIIEGKKPIITLKFIKELIKKYQQVGINLKEEISNFNEQKRKLKSEGVKLNTKESLIEILKIMKKAN